jgi:hypothetical protein
LPKGEQSGGTPPIRVDWRDSRGNISAAGLPSWHLELPGTISTAIQPITGKSSQIQVNKGSNHAAQKYS